MLLRVEKHITSSSEERRYAQDIPEHHFFMTYQLTESEGVTSLFVRQEDPRPSQPDESTGGDEGPDVLSCLKELV